MIGVRKSSSILMRPPKPGWGLLGSSEGSIGPADFGVLSSGSCGLAVVVGDMTLRLRAFAGRATVMSSE